MTDLLYGGPVNVTVTGARGPTGPKGDPGSPGEGYATRSALIAALTGATAGDDFYLTEPGRQGKFIWDPTVPIATHQIDTLQGVYLPRSATANGAAVRVIEGGAYDVAWWGALPDCPDFSGLTAVTSQATIRSQIASATNNIGAFQIAFRVIFTRGGGKLRFGPGIYRINWTNTWQYLTMGANTELEGVGGARLEYDVQGFEAAGLAFTGRVIPAGREGNGLGLSCGDPFTGTRDQVTFYDPLRWLATGSYDASSMVGGLKFRNVHVTMHTRVYWHSYTFGAAGQPYLLFPGFYLIYTRGLVMENCSVTGTPNDGFDINGDGFALINCRGVRCGHGGAESSPQNSFSLTGLALKGNFNLSNKQSRVIGCSSHNARDTALMFYPHKMLQITSFQSLGDHDAGIEGDYGSSTTLTSSSIGWEIGNEVTISGVDHDGYHDVTRVSGAHSAGATTIQVSDAFLTAKGGAGGDRYVYLGGTRYTVSAVNYSANQITIPSPGLVGGLSDQAKVEVRGRGVLNIVPGNELRARVENVHGRRVYGNGNAIAIQSRSSGGYIEVNDCTLEDVNVPVNYGAFGLAGAEVHYNNLTVTNAYAPEATANQAAIRVAAARLFSGRAVVDSSGVAVGSRVKTALLGYIVGYDATTFSTSIDELETDGTQQYAIELYFGASLNRPLSITNCKFWNNASYYPTSGYVRITNSPGFTIPEVVMTGNAGSRYNATADSGGGICPVNFAGGGSGGAAGTIGAMYFKGNKWGGDWKNSGGSSYGGTVGTVTGAIIDVENDLPGQRHFRATSKPADSVGVQGDYAENALPSLASSNYGVSSGLTSGSPNTYFQFEGTFIRPGSTVFSTPSYFPDGTFIRSQTDGTPGGNGNYVLSQPANATVAGPVTLYFGPNYTVLGWRRTATTWVEVRGDASI